MGIGTTRQLGGATDSSSTVPKSAGRSGSATAGGDAPVEKEGRLAALDAAAGASQGGLGEESGMAFAEERGGLPEEEPRVSSRRRPGGVGSKAWETGRGDRRSVPPRWLGREERWSRWGGGTCWASIRGSDWLGSVYWGRMGGWKYRTLSVSSLKMSAKSAGGCWSIGLVASEGNSATGDVVGGLDGFVGAGRGSPSDLISAPLHDKKGIHSPYIDLRSSIILNLLYGLHENSVIDSNRGAPQPSGRVTADGIAALAEVSDVSATAGAPCLISSSRHACILLIA
jgi:hypothetical protein